MSDLVSALGWLLLALLWVRILGLLLWPPQRGVHAPVPGPGGSTVPSPRAPGDDREPPPPRPAPPAARRARTGVLLLGARAQDVDAARTAAARHLAFLGLEPTRSHTSTTTARHDDLDLGAARVAVLGNAGAADSDAALVDCSTAGLPLLLPARA